MCFRGARQLRYAEKEWDAGGQEEEGLLRGSNLSSAEDWYAKRKEDLGQREITYIEKSVEERDRIQREKEEAKERERQKELEDQKKKKRFTEVIAIASAAAAVLAIGLSWWALDQKAEAVANGYKAEALVLNNNYENNKDYAQSYYEMLTVAIKATEMSDKFSTQKLNVLSTLFNFIYQPESAEYYSQYKDLGKKNAFGERLGLLRHSSSVSTVSFSPDGKTLASGSVDSTIKIWDLAIESILPRACKDTMNNMEHWVLLKNKSVKDVEQTLQKCKAIIANQPKRKEPGKEYDYLAEARINLMESYNAETNEDKKLKQENAISNFKEALKVNPDFAPAKSELIAYYFNSENPELALEYFSDKEYFYLKRARRADDKEKKISDYLEAIKLNPKFPLAKEELATIYFNEGKEKEAFDLVKDKEYLYLNRARKKEGEEKRKDLQEAHKLNSKLQPVRLELAEIHIQKGKEFFEKIEYDNTISELTKAIEMVPNRAVFYDYRGDVYYAKGEIKKAIDDYETFLDLETSDHWRMNEETKKFLKTEEGKQVSQDELKLALEFSERSLKLIPDNPHYLDTLAEIYLKLGDKSNSKKINDKLKVIATEQGNQELLKMATEREGRLK